ncbi:MAG TPA: DUF333 domain-containing protein [Clostridia bacterium]|nr:DUF333 domain-containing protein [Clostridia bacterium]
MSKNKLFFLLLVPFFFVAALGYWKFRYAANEEGKIFTAQNGGEKESLPNPASQNCLDKGGKLKSLQETAGSLGICQFDDGTECEEWQFYRQECQKGQYQKADTTHPYRGFINKSGQNYTFKSESGVGYSLSLTKEAGQALKERLLTGSDSGQAVTIIASETPPLSKTLILKGFQEK